MKTLRISISKGNIKTGMIPSVSLPPGKTCTSDACKCCLKACYAAKIARLRPNVASAWQRNLEIWLDNPTDYFAKIKAFLRKNSPRFFRWHVGGDIPSMGYLCAMRAIAREFPETHFLAFSKRYNWIEEHARLDPPANLQIVASIWPGISAPKAVLDGPCAYMRDKKQPDPRIPDGILECPGNCETCAACWHLGKLERSVVFDKH